MICKIKYILKVYSVPYTLRYRSRQQRCSVKKVFLEISSNLLEDTCARASSLIKLQARGVFPWIIRNFKEHLFLKNASNCCIWKWKTNVKIISFRQETLAQVFSCECCETSQNTFFYRTPLLAASGQNKRYKKCTLFSFASSSLSQFHF